MQSNGHGNASGVKEPLTDLPPVGEESGVLRLVWLACL